MTLSETQRQHLAMELADALYEAEVRAGALGELRKAFEYFRTTGSRARLLAMLDQRQQFNQPFQQNRNTAEHCGRINRVLRAFLAEQPRLEDPDFLPVLGWAVRLAQYRDRAQAPALSLDLPRPAPATPAARPLTPPKQGNDRSGTVSGRAGGRWQVELEGGFVVQAGLSGQVRQVRSGDRVSVRITRADGETLLGEIRKLL